MSSPFGYVPDGACAVRTPTERLPIPNIPAPRLPYDPSMPRDRPPMPRFVEIPEKRGRG